MNIYFLAPVGLLLVIPHSSKPWFFRAPLKFAVDCSVSIHDLEGYYLYREILLIAM